ncbi:succinate dehydrogenase/fumarate reductase iron-sulfur subunit [Natrialbaceae archaeon AArc-T1-2]|uniref:succinate dehydrogenase/fumarate reductase iron-sulfur subunit n=1 Tax=Natrialbaceae archaeon AArc-T1-2 TaxID=3053904 RepID=UPI00255B3D29|nr:succinate dehydrogenase iron-sulfur subunit [Natrialbaceae archaeon AArc-T1-2]WIV67033.1 succinate dehydrogenase iron-sulfur subunit [Natrialbaceae archaeon AArc-T1-2]
MTEQEFTVHRYDPETDDEAQFESYDVPITESTSVLDGLFYIQETLNENLSMRFSCRQGVCGSCCMEINGKARLACQTPVTDLADQDVTVRPMYNLPVIKDLVVDMDPFFESFEEIDPSFEADGRDEDSETAVIPPDSREREVIDPRTDCVGCGACYSSCSVAGETYLGPAAINKAVTLLKDSRETKTDERLARLSETDGVWGCHVQGECSDVCPKDIPVSEGIQLLKRDAVKRGIKARLFSSD